VKQVTLAYGETGLTVDVPDDAVVLRPTDLPGLPDEAGAIADSISSPLAPLMSPGVRVAVVFPDITRPMPNRTVLPPLLGALEALGAGPDRVRLLCATGTHRQATAAEMRELVGDAVFDRYEIVDHVATDAGAHVQVGAVDGVPVLIDRHYVDADVRILTGFVEPHFFAGFSGGPKGVCPGLAGLETILEAHSPTRIASPDATWLRLEGNPVHDFVRAAYALAPASLSVDVAINNARQVTAVFAGQLPGSHREACGFVEASAVQPVDEPFDVVVTTNAGYPLDRNLYQCVKGMAAAERIVRPGGTIVMAAECRDGIPADGEFGRLLAEAASPGELLSPDAAPSLDRWEAQVLARVLQTAEVHLHTGGLRDEQVRQALLRPIADITSALHGRVCVLPFGPLTVGSPPHATVAS
jgi:nickel-dependent lactate racemase